MGFLQAGGAETPRKDQERSTSLPVPEVRTGKKINGVCTPYPVVSHTSCSQVRFLKHLTYVGLLIIISFNLF